MPYVSRVNQIDAGQLDNEIFKVLRGLVVRIAQHFQPGQIDVWQPEIDAFLKILIWYHTLKNGKSTFGQQLLNLNYDNLNKNKAVLYLMLTVLPEYAQQRLIDRRVPANETERKIRTCIEWVNRIIKILQFINLITFLNRGTQPHIVERLLGISSQNVAANKPRNIGYSYMTRELLWHGLIELFSLGLPLINVHYIKQIAMRFWTSRRRNNVIRTVPTMTLSTKCAYCDATPILPTHAGCEHIFCYYCLKANFTAISMYQCPKCNTELHAEDMHRYVVTDKPLANEEE